MAEKCCYCEEDIRYNSYTPHHPNSITVEHLVPRSKGGSNRKENKQPCCKRCNQWRKNKDYNQWIGELKRKLRYNHYGTKAATIKTIIKNALKWKKYIKQKGESLLIKQQTGMKELAIDIETYSEYDITKCGAYKYCEAPGFEVLLFGYSIDGGPVKVINMLDTILDGFPDDIYSALTDSNVLKTAFNANFERTALAKYFGLVLPPEQWSCTMAKASMFGLPLSLGAAAKALNVDVEKDTAGKALIKYFAMPCKPTKANGQRTRNLPHHDPEKWAQFTEYCRKDVVVEQAIREKLKLYKVPDTEIRLWNLDQKINDRGIKVDTVLVNNAIGMSAANTELLTTEAVQLTGLENPNSASQLKKWLSDQLGTEIKSLTKSAIPELLEDIEEVSDDDGYFPGEIDDINVNNASVRRMLEIRQEMAKTSVKKYMAMRNGVCLDTRVRGLLQYYGANRTGRWAGRLVQVQNLPQNHLPDLDLARQLVYRGDMDAVDLLFGNVPDTLSQLIRTAFVAPKGYRFIVADFSAIEARVIAWLANEKWRLDVFNTHGKIYEASAAQMFKVPIESVTKGSDLRQKGKVAELACIAEGQLVLTDCGLVPIERVTLKHRVFDGDHFVSHDGVVFKGFKKTITYEGLTATPDHLVWVEGQSNPISFGDAASSRKHLLQSRPCRSSIWKRRDNKSREAMGEKMERRKSVDRMQRVRNYSMDFIQQPQKKYFKRLSVMLTTKASSVMALQAAYSGKTEMRKPQRQELRQLRSKRDLFQLQNNFRSWNLDNGQCEELLAPFRNGSYKHKRELRTWKYSIYRKNTQSSKSEKIKSAFLERSRMAIFENSGDPNVKFWHDKRTNYRKCKNRSCRKTKELEIDSTEVRTYDILNAGPKSRFTVSGVLVHNCGYQGGPDALVSMGALKMGIREEELPKIIKQWRNANKKIVEFWYTVGDAALKAVGRGIPVTIQFGIKFFMQGGNLFIELPSGRRLCYLTAKVIDGRFGEVMVYGGIDQKTRQWKIQETYGGKLVENIVQAVARDCLADAMLRVDAAGYKIAMHVHDEIVCEAPEGFGSLEEINTIMGMTIPWAKGLPLKADSYETTYYKKD